MYVETSKLGKMDLGFKGLECNWGTHIAGLYENDEQRDEIILGFLNKGDLENDLNLYCPVEITEKEFSDKYEEKFPSCAHHLHDENCFSFFSAESLYYPNGIFSPREMDKGLNSFFENSQSNGKRNVRATAEMVWALQNISGVENLMVYESRLNYFIKNKPWISICLYNVNKFSGAQIVQVLQTHPYVITGGKLLENSFYVDPDKWLKQNAPNFLG